MADIRPQCDRCEVIDEPDNDVVVKQIDNEKTCIECRRDELQLETFLSEREAHVLAAKELTDATHSEIADLLKVEKSTIDEYSRRINNKMKKSRRTTELPKFHQ